MTTEEAVKRVTGQISDPLSIIDAHALIAQWGAIVNDQEVAEFRREHDLYPDLRWWKL